MTVVVDASVALYWVLPGKETEHALALWDRWEAASELVIAPPIFRPEVTNVLHRKAHEGRVNRPDATEMLDLLLNAVAPREPSRLYTRALTLADELGLRTTYDALYLSLGELEGCEVWTADLRFHRSAHRRFPRVKAIDEAPG